MIPNSRQLGAIAAVTAAVLVVYWQVLWRLVDAWTNDGNYSHGFLIVPLAAWFAWERRERLRRLAIRPAWSGLVLLGCGVLLLLAGLLGSEQFVTRVSLLITLTGIVLFLFGWAHLKVLAFPLAFLALMIPPPAILFNQITFPLQLVASQVGEFAIAACNIPVLREGNVLVLATTKLEVAEACSGIRSLVSLITLGIVYGYFVDQRPWVRTVIVLSTIPVAIFSNGARVAGTGMAAHWIGPEAAQGFFHDFSGWVVFVVAFVMILVVRAVIARIAPEPSQAKTLATV